MSQSAKKPRVESVDGHSYLSGFGSYFSSEALPGALPDKGHTPQKCPYGLYAEQISGTAFTKVKHANQRTWCYRMQPAAAHAKWTKLDATKYAVTQEPTVSTPEQLRWKPLPFPTAKTNWVEGMHCYAGAGDAAARAGIRIYVYACNADMVDCSFTSSDGDMLFVPQSGTLEITTEMGKMTVPPNFICVIQRGIRFSISLPDGQARGYVCEVFDSHFELPPLGVIGANGLSNTRDFETVTAAYERRDAAWTCYQKFNGEMWSYPQDHSPFDVVAWHGNYAPFRYDLSKYCVINSVSFDHLDPCIFCVLTAQTGDAGVASCDFVIFPPRWMVATNTFRPPYYHKNIMSEFMGNIRGVYEAKTDGGFQPGGASLHSTMAAHGPSKDVFEKCSNMKLEPMPPNDDALAFMFESYYGLRLTPFAAEHLRDHDYQKESWSGFKTHFDEKQRTPK